MNLARVGSATFPSKAIIPLVGICFLWFSLRISFFFGLFPEELPSPARRESYYSCYLGFFALSLLLIACFGRRIDVLVRRGNKTARVLAALSAFSFALSMVLSYNGIKCPIVFYTLFACAGASCAFLCVSWGVVLVKAFSQQANIIVALAFLLHMAISMAFSSLHGVALGCGVCLTALVSAGALCFAGEISITPNNSRLLLGKQSQFGADDSRAEYGALRRAGVLTVICIYIGAFMWGFFAPPVIGEVTFPQHLITFFVSTVTFLFIAVLPSNKNIQHFRRSVKITLVILLFFGLFLIIALGSESYVGTSVLIAALFCLEMFAWIVIASGASRSQRSTSSWFGAGLFVTIAVPTLVRNILGPYLYRYLGVFDHAGFGHYVLLITTFALLVVTVLFLNADNRGFESLAKQQAQGERTAGISERKLESLAEEDGLTARELEIISLVAQGNSQKRIADLLCISPSTVQTHMKSIYRRLGIHSKQALVDLIHHM